MKVGEVRVQKGGRMKAVTPLWPGHALCSQFCSEEDAFPTPPCSHSSSVQHCTVWQNQRAITVWTENVPKARVCSEAGLHFDLGCAHSPECLVRTTALRSFLTSAFSPVKEELFILFKWCYFQVFCCVTAARFLLSSQKLVFLIKNATSEHSQVQRRPASTPASEHHFSPLQNGDHALPSRSVT